MSVCLSPYTLREPEGVKVPCGKCPACLKRRASGWSFRLMRHERNQPSAHFVTLTLNDESIKENLTSAGYLSLRKRDVQLFFKRLRFNRQKSGKSGKITYYVCGEYGSLNRRPHYHAIIFGADSDDYEEAWSVDGRSLGHIFVGNVTGASVGYVLKYMSKPKTCPQHSNDDRLPEFQLTSKGLGANYLTPAMVRWHLADLDNRMYCNAEGGVKISMPRYYKDKIYNDEQRERIAFISQVRAQQDDLSVFEKMGLDIQEFNRVLQARKDAAYKKMYKSSLLRRG